MKKFNALFVLLLGCFALTTQAQQNAGIRYLDEVFDNVIYSPWEPRPDDGFAGQFYGQNATVLSLLDANPDNDAHPLNLPLWYDLYMPAGDTASTRPLALVFHTGNFLPHPANGGTGGTVRDSTVIETCRRLAKMGYVAAAVSYRLGWNPIAPTQDERVFGLINAAYRGVQDARTAVRFFKATAAALGNPYKIDPGKIVLWGIGTGGYITLNTAALDDYNKVLIPKFITIVQGQPVPMVIEAVNGDIEGKTVGQVPTWYPIFTPGDTLNYPQWTEFSSDFQLAVNMGGAMGDSSWIDPGQVPILSYHDPGDQNAPYGEGIVNVPVVNLAVVEVQGSYLVQKLQEEFGNNDAWDDLENATMLSELSQAVNTVADSRNDGYNGLFPLPTPDNNGAAWDFFSADNPNAGDPPYPDIEQAKLVYDSIMAHFAPRACVTLQLTECLDSLFFVDTREALLQDAAVNLTIAPNPASEIINLQTGAKFPIKEVMLFDMSGRLVQTDFDVHSNSYQLKRNDLLPGMYFLRLRFEEGILTKKVVFR